MAQEAHEQPDSTADELLQAAHEVARSGTPRLVRAEGMTLTIAPGEPPRRKRRRAHGRPFTFDDPLWDIVGIAKGTGPDNVSGNVDKYLMQAYDEEFP